MADTYVRSDRPTGNFGSASKLAVDASPSEHILLRFSVSGVGPNTVANARLRLYNVNRSPKGGDVYHVADDSWGEATVTWSTAPAADPTPVASFGSVVTNTWYEVDLTSLITGDGTYSLRIASTLSDGADYTSREGAAGFGPQLLVTLGAPSDTTPPSVSISSPADGQTVGGVVTVQVEASDDVAVTEVDLSVDGVLFGTDATAPYEFPWNTGASVNGAHTLQASARDAAANASTSAPVTVTVTNAPDTSPPTAPTNLSAAVVGGTRIDLQWAASSDDHGVHHYAVLRDGGEIGTSTTPSYSDTAVSPGATYGYSVVAFDAAGNPSPPSGTVSVTVPSSFSFAAAGDHAAGSKTSASLSALDASGVSFYLALGDLDYDETPTDAAWCDFVKSRLPTLGPTFPFQLVSGNHEEQGGSNGYILNHAACLPDRLGSTLGPSSQYAAEYYFDYPAAAPLARVIMIAPDLTIENVTYGYASGDPHYTWLASVIDGARASGIPWVVVGMHKVCLTVGVKSCQIGPDLMNLLIEKKVDLVLQAHDHTYQRSKQLALASVTCPAVPVGTYDPDCVADDGTDDAYPKGAGTIFVIDGTFGHGTLYPTSQTDPEAPYFVATGNTSWGFETYTVSADRIDARYVASSGSFSDAFSILAGGSAVADRTPPSAPAGLMATATSASRVDLSWTPSTDDVGVTGYTVFRDGNVVGTTASTTFADTTVFPNTSYTYHVRARDLAGNVSQPSGIASVSTPSAGATLIFAPVADAYIRPDYPNNNFGSATTLLVDGSPVKHFLVRFAVSGVGPGAIASAKLRLYAVNGSSSGGDFYRVADTTWGEASVTWNTAPAADPLPLASLGAVAVNAWYEVDVTSLVTGDGTYSLRVTSTSSDGADYTSREGTAAFIPQLVVTLAT